MAFENSAEQYRSREVQQPSTTTLLPNNHEMQNYFRPHVKTSSEAVFIDFGTHENIYSKNSVVAQNVEFMPPPTLLPDPEITRIIGEVGLKVTGDAYKYNVEHPYRNQELSRIATIPSQSFSEAYTAFPELKLIGKLSETNVTQLIKAVIANELYHYDWKDKVLDSATDALHGSGPTQKVTVGYSQISIKGARDLANEYEKEVKDGDRATNPLKKYLTMTNDQIRQSLNNPADLPLLVAANLAHNVKMYHRHGYPITEETLGYGFNPDLPPQKKEEHHELLPPSRRLDQSTHAHNINVWMKQIRAAEGDMQER